MRKKGNKYNKKDYTELNYYDYVCTIKEFEKFIKGLNVSSKSPCWIFQRYFLEDDIQLIILKNPHLYFQQIKYENLKFSRLQLWQISNKLTDYGYEPPYKSRK